MSVEQNLAFGLVVRKTPQADLQARANVLLMDEPFSAVDRETRRQLESVLVDFHQQHQATILHVSYSYSPETWPADVILSMESLNPGTGG